VIRGAIRRRWWIVLLCVIGVAAIAQAVAELRSRTATAEAVVIMDAGTIAPTPVPVDQSVRLAGDLAQVLPRDDAVLRAIAERSGLPARGHVTTRTSRGSSLVFVGYRAAREADAVRGARTLAGVISSPSPVSAAIAPGSLRAVRLPSTARRTRIAGKGYVATVVLVASAGGRQTGPGYGDQVTRLAPSFAASLPDDAGVLAFVARRLGVTADEVDDNFTVENDKDTAVLRLRYKARGKDEANRGARALAAAVAGQTPASATLRPGTFTLVRVGGAKRSSANPAAAVPVGAALGLFLGLALVLALERARPRVDDQQLLEDELRCPAFLVTDVTPSLAGSLLERWRSLGRSEQPTVALIPASVGVEKATAGLAERLTAQAGPEGNGSAPVSGPLRLVIGRDPAHDPAGASVAARSDVAVLVVAQGEQLAHVQEACRALTTFEVPVRWALLLHRRARRGLERDADVVAEPAAEPADATPV
jgi:hypothetical protein